MSGCLNPRQLVQLVCTSSHLYTSAYFNTCTIALESDVFSWCTFIHTFTFTYFYTGSNCSRVCLSVQTILSFTFTFTYLYILFHWKQSVSGCPNPHQPFSLVLTIRHTPTNQPASKYTPNTDTTLHNIFAWIIFLQQLKFVQKMCSFSRVRLGYVHFIIRGKKQEVERFREIETAQAFIPKVWNLQKNIF